MFNFDQYKMLMLAALTGYVGTLLRGIPTRIANFCFYWFGYTINTSTDIGWDSYMGVYMGVRKIVPKKKKYYNHMGAVMEIGTHTLIYANVDTKIDGYEYLTKEEQDIIDHNATDHGKYSFLMDEKTVNCYIRKIKSLPTGTHLIYLGRLTWIKINSMVDYKQNTTGGARGAYMQDSGSNGGNAKPNHRIDIAVFGLEKSKYMNIFKQTEKYWTDYFGGKLFTKKPNITNFEELEKALCKQTEFNYLRLISAKSGGNRTTVYKPERNFDSIFLNNKYDILEAFRKFLKIDTIRKYQSLQIPYKLNILLYGKPGTGKTSVLYALINEFTVSKSGYLIEDLNNVLYEPFNEGVIPMEFNNTSPTYKQHIFEKLPNLTFKVDRLNIIEEIDTMFGLSMSGTRENQNAEIGGSGNSFEDLLSNSTGKLKTMLEWLDGSKTPFGNICICTTNHIDRLDPALIRRFDYIFHIDGICEEIVDEMLSYYGFDRSILDKFNKEDYIMENNLANPSKLSSLLIHEMKGE